MDRWAWEQLDSWLNLRADLPIGALFCVLRGPPRGLADGPAHPAASVSSCATPPSQPGRVAGWRHISRDAHAVEISREGVPLVVIRRQLGHADLGVTCVYLRGIDNTEIVHAVHERPATDDPCGQRASASALSQTSQGPRRLARPTATRPGAIQGGHRPTVLRRQQVLSVEGERPAVAP